MKDSRKEIKRLLRELKAFYRKEGRGYLPWRTTKDPYKILVSEVMLQQTQVGRVVPFYNRFLKQFPNANVLARAKLSDVLKVWQGLGYNRRAKFLHEAGKTIATHGFPKEAEDIEQLPGVGHYTARAIATFAFSKPETFIETNIRTVFIHFCFPQKKKVSDKEILLLIPVALEKSKMQPRDFYKALMDYGSYLKKQGITLNSRSRHYAKQSTFEGSARQLRGALIRELLEQPQTLFQLTKNLSPRTGEEVEQQLMQLLEQGLLVQVRGLYHIGE